MQSIAKPGDKVKLLSPIPSITGDGIAVQAGTVGVLLGYSTGIKDGSIHDYHFVPKHPEGTQVVVYKIPPDSFEIVGLLVPSPGYDVLRSFILDLYRMQVNGGIPALSAMFEEYSIITEWANYETAGEDDNAGG